MINADYDRDFVFDIDAYLVETYPKMNMATRRAICRLAIDSLETEEIEDSVDAVVANYAIEAMDYRDPYEDDEE